MRIEAAEIYGFGKWQDKTFDFENENFISIIGDNEAGKSTIQNFFLFILFGMSPKQREKYLPKKGGRMGGKLVVSEIISTPITIERLHDRYAAAAKIYLANGEVKDEEWLKVKLAGLNADNYRAIYSFDAKALLKLPDMRAKELNEVLLGVGMTGSDYIYQIEKNLTQAVADKFKPSGKKPSLNQAFEDLQKKKEKLMQLEAEENDYQKEIAAKNEANQKLNELEQRIRTEKETKEHTELKKAYYENIETFHVLSKRLEGLDRENKIPAHAKETYDEYHQMLMPLKSEQSVLEENYKKLKEKKKELEEKFLSDTEFRQLENAMGNVTDIKRMEEEEERLQTRIDQLLLKQEYALDSLQIKLSASDLETLELPFHIESLWSELVKNKEKWELEKNYIQNEMKTLEMEKKAVKDRLTQFNIDEERVKEIGEIENRLEQHKEQEEALSLKAHLMDLDKKGKNEEQKTKMVLWISFIMAGVLSLMYIALDKFVLLIAAFLLFLSGAMYFIHWNSSKNVRKKLVNLPSGDAVNLSEQEKAELEKKIASYKEDKEQQSSLEKELKSINMELLKLKERDSFTEEQLENVQLKVKEQIEQFPFLQTIELSYWPKVIHALLPLQERMREISEVKIDKRDLTHQKADVNERIEKFLNNITAISPTSDRMTKEALSQYYEESVVVRRELHQLDNQLVDLDKKLRDIVTKQNPYQNAITDLFKETGVNSESEFLETVDYHDKVQKLKEERETLHFQLSTWLTQEELVQISKGDYANLTILKNQLEETETILSQLAEEADKLRQRIATHEMRIKQLEESEYYSTFKHDYLQQLEKLQEQAKEWAVYQVALNKLQQTKEFFQEKYIPDIFEKASTWLQELTYQNHEAIFPPSDKIGIRVKAGDGTLFEIDELSQATMDQVYIALRFALSEVMQTEQAYPFIIDDGFVHFDPIRHKKIIQLLKKLSAKQQIFYFSTSLKEEAGYAVYLSNK
ncbi:AAA family ATPase [Saliterribacillus persicus]|uniref:Uncharacterized protein YhaN n=1 Tax=Saliterribacillus persicus TaxID=930114 RepID=A0A368XT14_9BACI|nr:AAA family ATPase [Saliterribacillus persicus]RCW69657.1 uncharacterized protein YhaN [Saliterribacillus persicus]